MSTYERSAGPGPAGPVRVEPRAVRTGGPRHDTTASPTTGPARAPHLGGLDGLRALAIAAVVTYHLDPGWLPGGFLGVDVFFVVSGFLITTLLVREAEQARAGGGRATVRLGRFYVRRARRLLPALVVVIVVATLVARVVHPDLLVHVGRSIAGALTFTTNWVEITAGASYFDQTAPQLFVNTWSLAVEEQFYLLWPLAVLALLTLTTRTRPRVATAAGIGVASAALMALLVVPGQDATRVYYGTDTHLVGLMLGAALAFAYAAPGHGPLGAPRWEAARRPALVAAGAVLGLLVWRCGEDGSAPFRGGIALASLATTVLVAGLLPTPGSGRSRWRTVMDAPVLGWVGRRSYGIYLWHWPVAVMVGLDEPAARGTTAYVLTRVWVVLVTLACADLSYRFVEAPVRVWGFRACAAMVLRAVLSPFGRLPRVVAGTTVLLLLLTVAVVATAPRRTSTEAMLDANAAAAAGDPTPVSTPGATPGMPGYTAPARTPSATASAPSTTAPAPTTTAKAPSAAEAARWAMPSGGQMDVFGDSIVVGSIHALQYYFPGIRSDAKSNRRWSDGLAQVQAHSGDLRRAVVLDFGTNAGVDEATARRVLDLVGPDRMVVLVTIFGKASWIDDANATIRRLAQGRSNVVVADWNAAIAPHPELLQSDGIHPTITGAHLFAKTVRAALAQLSEQHTGTKVTLPDLPAF
ncbi:acyltransferase family protein [Lapillicoccus jejuensis]|uniref:Peptidoglycan/LPS O-acetylase OafA/YrhL n=1 Tax=Lapillicoccus jejuensis TaxID=402171 RepID=A0A542E3C8_9MICO|nr:acyltransferase family protein [Lapillicoccus jejuensis]TQJ09799.1 peptidoglycan/LPS O-acetylase OafA/YrhL [Lapillicoccus jejuensis]